MSQLVKDHPYVLGVFTDPSHERWHFVNAKWDDAAERRRLFRRITIAPEDRLRTAAERLALIDAQPGIGVLDLKEKHDRAFDVERVTDQFFREYQEVFRGLEEDLAQQTRDKTRAHDYALQYLNRLMFIYFIQRKRWLGDNPEFMTTYWDAYHRASRHQDTFNKDWLSVLFFEAFNKKFSHPQYMPKELRDVLAQAPWLNGGLFTRNRLDQAYEFRISDDRFFNVFQFFQKYNFTIREDSPLDQEVAVDPEMMGRVYESLVNVAELTDERGEAGIFYTPRTEIDLMCRLALTDYLANHRGGTDKGLLYDLVFAIEPEEKEAADATIERAALWPEVDRLLRELTVIDPACGSGSFLIGMLSVLSDLGQRASRVLGRYERDYELKRRVIGDNLYGVDVKPWAVDVCELRLWLQLVVETDLTKEERLLQPLLPNLSFKIRRGDSLVQELGSVDFSLLRHGFIQLDKPLKGKLTRLKGEKLDFYLNPMGTYDENRQKELEQKELAVFREILDSRIQDMENEIKRITKSLEQRKADLFGEVTQALEPGEATRRAAKREELLGQIDRMKEARRALTTTKDVPFVWDIGFVEVFEGDKEGFDIVIGNPPYVRHQQIAPPLIAREQVTAENKREYKVKLQRSVYAAFPSYFGYDVHKDIVTKKLDARSDLYIYFYFLALSLLNPKGTFCFLTSNSWLDRGFGSALQEFLTKHTHIKFIIDNQLQRSFTRSDINTIIVLFSAPDERKPWDLERVARFVMFKVPFELVLRAKVMLELENSKARENRDGYRVHPISQTELLQDGLEVRKEGIREQVSEKGTGLLAEMARHIGNKWGGKYLRAPDIFHVVLKKARSSLMEVNQISRIDTYLILPKKADQVLVLDAGEVPANLVNYFKPFVRSPKYFDTPLVTSSPHCILVCTAQDVASDGNLRAFVAEAARRLANEFSAPPSRKDWYVVNQQPGRILWNRRHGDRHLVLFNPHEFLSYDFYKISLLESKSTSMYKLMVAALLSTVTWLFKEVYGETNLGQGALKTEGTDLARIYTVAPEQLLEAKEPVEEILHRPLKGVREEVYQPDRRSLDEIVFNILGLTREERDAVYEAVISLVETRLKKAESV